jgi:manganese/iron transport system permease protein
MWVSALVGAVCAFLSAYLMLKGWSLIGDALSHSIVPGVAGAYMLGLPFALGAFLSGGLAAGAMLFLNQRTGLKEDTIIGLIFTSLLRAGAVHGLGLASVPINVQTIVMGNILAISPADTLQLAIIGFVSLAILLAKWKDLMAAFFDEAHARSIGLRPGLLRLMFFTLLSASCVAALQTVGAFLVIAMVVTPGATAYLLTDRFPRLLALSVAIGTLTCFLGAYLSFFLDGATGGVIICLQTLIFLAAFTFAPKARLPCRPPPRGPGTGGVMDWLLAPFHFPFMQNAFLAAALIVPPTALLSCLLVLKGWSLMGDAISHATLPGIVIAYVAGLPLVLGAFAAGMACALAVGFLGDNSRVKRDTVMGVVFSGMFGLGIVLYTWTETDLHLDHILFGNILGIGREDLDRRRHCAGGHAGPAGETARPAACAPSTRRRRARLACRSRRCTTAFWR